MKVDNIVREIIGTQKMFSEHIDYSKKPGLYAFSISGKSGLQEFGKEGQILYVGKAEKSLSSRDLDIHFKDGKTGSSTLRRSIGTILKGKIKATSFTRDGTISKAAIDHFRFDNKSEIDLSLWMKANLKIGYWVYDALREKSSLYDLEEKVIIQLRPILDLDKRTKKYNIYADELTQLRQICKSEAHQNAMQGRKLF
jgi:hypothetical protein